MLSDLWSIVRDEVTRLGAKWEDLPGRTRSAAITADGMPGVLLAYRLSGGAVEVRSDGNVSPMIRDRRGAARHLPAILGDLGDAQPRTAADVARLRPPPPWAAK